MKRNFPIACLSCRKKKIKCDGQFPCGSCSTKSSPCEYQEPRKRGPKTGLLAKLREENEKLRRCVNESLEIKNKEEVTPKNDSPPMPNSFLENLPFPNAGKDSLKYEINMGMNPTIGGFSCHQSQLYLGIYFNFLNKILPMVDEEKLKRGLSQLSSLPTQESYGVSLQLNAILAIISRISSYFTQAEEFFRRGREIAKEVFDEPSEDVISGLALLAYYCYGMSDPSRAGYYLVLGAKMSRKIRPNDLLLASYYVLCLGNPDVIPLLPPPRQLTENDSDYKSIFSEFMLDIFPICLHLIQKNSRGVSIERAKEFLGTLDKAWKVQETWNLGGKMNFSFRIIINGLRGWLYGYWLGDQQRAIEHSNIVCNLAVNKFNVFFCSFVGGLCLHVAKFHLNIHQESRFFQILPVLNLIADRWPYMKKSLFALYDSRKNLINSQKFNQSNPTHNSVPQSNSVPQLNSSPNSNSIPHSNSIPQSNSTPRSNSNTPTPTQSNYNIPTPTQSNYTSPPLKSSSSPPQSSAPYPAQSNYNTSPPSKSSSSPQSSAYPAQPNYDTSSPTYPFPTQPNYNNSTQSSAPYPTQPNYRASTPTKSPQSNGAYPSQPNPSPVQPNFSYLYQPTSLSQSNSYSPTSHLYSCSPSPHYSSPSSEHPTPDSLCFKQPEQIGFDILESSFTSMLGDSLFF